MNKGRRNYFRDKLRQFLVAGTAGAFLSILFHNLPRDLRGISLYPDWPYTVDLFVRYGYLIWMLLYFFMSAYSTEEDEEHPWYALGFGIAQSVCALYSQYWLGFVQTGQPDSGRPGYIAANITIVIISILSWRLFSYDNSHLPSGLKWVTINKLRAFTFTISAVSLALAWSWHQSLRCLSWTMAVSESILWLNLFAYIGIRLNMAPSPDTSKSQETTQPVQPIQKKG